MGICAGSGRPPRLFVAILLLFAPCFVLSARAAARAAGTEAALPLEKVPTAVYERQHAARLEQAVSSGQRFVLRCHYATNDGSVQTMPVAAPFLDAVDDSGCPVLMQGHTQNGFFVPDTIESYEARGLGRWRRTFPVSRYAMEGVCASTLQAGLAEPPAAEGPNLVDMTAQTAVSAGRWAKGYALRFPQDRKMLVLFGDSLSDSGNLYYFLASRLLGLYTMPDRPYFYGQFSNRPVWNHYLTMPNRNLPRRYRNSRIRASLLDYAYGGMISGQEVASLLPPVRDIVDRIVLGVQETLCGNLQSMVTAYIDHVAGNGVSDPDNTIFVVYGGANDFDNFVNKRTRDYMFENPDGPLGYRTVAEAGATDHAASVQKLIDGGAKNVLVLTVPDLGVTPMVLLNQVFLKDDPSLSEDEKHYLLSREITRATSYYNSRLLRKMAAVQAGHPGVKLVTYDVNRTLQAVMRGQDPSTGRDFDYGIDTTGLKKTLDPPWGQAPPIVIYERCYRGDYDTPCKGDDCICPIANRAPYWDPEHPTSFVHCWMSHFLHQCLYQAGMIDVPPLDMALHREYCEELNP